MVAKVFIDGEAGTTGLQIRERLESRGDLQLLSIGEERRKDPKVRREYLNEADVVILCLPDAAAVEAVGMIESAHVRVIDASTAHRVSPGWTYGFPELRPGQRAAVAGATRVANPGCYPTGFLGLIAPLVRAGLVPADLPITVNAISGYSGGGRSMISEFEDTGSSHYTTTSYRPYALGLAHKHVPEMQFYSGLTHRPLFAPAVGRFKQGMIVEAPLQLAAMRKAPNLGEIRAALAEAYAGARFVEVASPEETNSTETLDAEALNGTNRLRLYAFGSETFGQARLAAVLDNLGKGASGAAVQSLNLMLGLDEATGL